MALFLYNNTENDLSFQGRDLLVGEFFQIPPPLYYDYSSDRELISAIEVGDVRISRDGVTLIESLENALSELRQSLVRSSLAVDKNGIDQNVSDNTATVVTADRIIWDVHEDYDLSTDDFVVPSDGVYSFDCQLKIENLSNVASIELAIYKRGAPDDYWFLLDKKTVGTLTEIQMHGATLFDFYKDERYAVKLTLTKVLPLVGCSCTISGDDDYTAWGYNLNYLF